MLEFLTSIDSVVFKDADILETGVPFQILDAVCGQEQKLLNCGVAGIPQLPVVTEILNQYFMGPHRTHTVVNSISPAGRFAFNAI